MAEPNNYGCTALHIASLRGHSEVVKKLLQFHAEVDVISRNWRRETALHLAYLGGYPGVVKSLLEAKASVDNPTCYGQTSLFLASVGRHSAMVKILLEANATH